MKDKWWVKNIVLFLNYPFRFVHTIHTVLFQCQIYLQLGTDGCFQLSGENPIKLGFVAIKTWYTWAPFSRSLRALTADKNPPTPLVEDTIGSAMGGAVDADGVVDWAFKLDTIRENKKKITIHFPILIVPAYVSPYPLAWDPSAELLSWIHQTTGWPSWSAPTKSWSVETNRPGNSRSKKQNNLVSSISS